MKYAIGVITIIIILGALFWWFMNEISKIS